MIQYCDVIIDVAYGDCGKGKISSHLASLGGYSHVCRYNGGANAGHTIYVKGKKLITHLVPSGVLHGIKSIVGPGCVVNPESFLREIEEIESAGMSTKGLIWVSNAAHIVTQAHIDEEASEGKIGTTKRGIGPAYRDKYDRKGTRAENCELLKPYLIDIYEEFYRANTSPRILFEGAQGFHLDIDHGDYPYVTSSHVSVGGAVNFGVPAQSIRKVWGAAKSYDTYVGAKEFEPKDPIFQKIREMGGEFGATTGRPRQCNWLNLDQLNKACSMSGVTDLVISKMDILKDLKIWKLISGGEVIEFGTEESFKSFIDRKLTGIISNIHFSYSPETI